MKSVENIKRLPVKVKKQLQTAMLLLCAIATFAVPAFGGGYNALKNRSVVSSAAAIQDVDLVTVAASAYGEAKKVMNAVDPEAKDRFIEHTEKLLGNGTKWHNLGLLIGPRDALSGSTYNAYVNLNSMSASEAATYGSGAIITSYDKYKMVGYAIQNLNNSAQKSNSSAVSVEEGLDSMSEAAIKLGGLGVKFLNDYNPGPLIISLYNSRNLSTYGSNKLIQLVKQNPVMLGIVELLGGTVGGTGLSFFLILNAVIAVIGLAFSMILTLMGGQGIGDGIKKFMKTIIIGTVGVYIISNLLATSVKWVTECVTNIGSAGASVYAQENLNFYDWYLTGFSLPYGTTLHVNSFGHFELSNDDIYAINKYTYKRLTGSDPTDDAMMERMQSYTQNTNEGMASFVTPSYNGADEGEPWATDVYYAILKNYAENNENGLLDPGGDPESPLNGLGDPVFAKSRYLWMSSMNATVNSDGSGSIWCYTDSPNYYGLNPISALNLIRSDFSGATITTTTAVAPKIAYVAFDTASIHSGGSAPAHMNSLIRFIACFTVMMAAIKGMIMIFSSGFGGLISGGVKTAFGSSGGLGQAIGAVFALVFGVIGISVIMSMTLSLLDTLYGITRELVGDVEVIDAFLGPVQESLKKVPVFGALLSSLANGTAQLILSLVLALTFPKLGGIPITMFAQFMSDLPGRISEQAQRIEGMLMSGRSSAGGGLGGGGSRGQYGRQAQAMAGQAYSSATRQAAGIVKSGAMAAASLAGAGLSMAGKALNKKGDAIEGKPSNPGVNGWDDLSPEQQAMAAEVAAATDGWDDMDQDARQKAMEEAGVFGGGNADEGSTNGRIEDAPEEQDGGASLAEEAAEAAPVEEEAPTEQSISEPETPIAPVDAQDSMNAASAEGTADGAPTIESAGGTVGESSGSAAGSSSGNTGGGSGDKSLNVKEGDNVQGTNQQISSNTTQESHVNATTVDQSNQLSSGTASADGKAADGAKQSAQGLNAGKTSESSKNNDVQTAGMQTAAAAGTGKASSGTLPTTGGQKSASGTAQAPAASQYTSVNNMGNTTEGNSEMSASAQINANNQLNAGSQQSVADPNAPETGGSLDHGTDKQSERAADKGASSESMNGTAKSKWGKDMTIKEQRTARAMHAVGDALQIAGGNRTLGDGIRDALGYAGEAAATSVLPPELMNGFAQDLRNRRQLRSELARNNRRNDNNKKG